MLPITQQLLSNQRARPFLRNASDFYIRQIKGLVVHWTGNFDKGAHAEFQARHFERTERPVSAHYIVDDTRIVQTIPENEVAFHTGGTRYKRDGDRIRETGLNPNYFLLGIEMCMAADGNLEKTRQHTAELCAHLLHKYAFGIQDLYRHFDITGKDCPGNLLDVSKWAAFRREVQKSLIPLIRPVAEASTLARIQTPAGGYIHGGPGNTYPETDIMANGAYLQLLEERNGWFALSADRWIHGEQVKIEPARNGKVTGTRQLNVRSGPATGFQIVRRLQSGERVQVIGEKEEWLRIGYSEWVYAGFIR